MAHKTCGKTFGNSNEKAEHDMSAARPCAQGNDVGAAGAIMTSIRKQSARESTAIQAAKVKHADLSRVCLEAQSANDILQERQPLKEIGLANAVPHPCPCVAFSSTALSATADLKSSEAPSLHKHWLKRHEVMDGRLPARPQPAPKVKKCFQLQYCVCCKEGRAVHMLWCRIMNWLKQGGLPNLDSLMTGSIVLLLRAHEEGVDHSMLEGAAALENEGHTHRFLDGHGKWRIGYIPLHYKSPWRPTFLLLLFADEQSFRNAEAWHADALLSFRCAGEQPAFHTPHTFCKGVPLEHKLDICLAELSETHAPWPHSTGLVRASPCCEQITIWDGLEQEEAKQRRRQRRQPANSTRGRRKGVETHHSNAECFPDNDNAFSDMGEVDALLDTENEQDDCADGWQDDMLLQNIDAASEIGDAAADVKTSHSSSSSSSSSSSPTNNDSDKGENATSTVAIGSASVGTPTDIPKPNPHNDSQAAGSMKPIERVRRPETFRLGQFRFTYRPPNAYQCTCLLHAKGAKTQCTKSGTFEEGDDVSMNKLLHHLQCWALRAYTVETKEQHQAGRGLPALDEMERAMTLYQLGQRLQELAE
eukprot:2701434-Amphidinium_carterae.3